MNMSCQIRLTKEKAVVVSARVTLVHNAEYKTITSLIYWTFRFRSICLYFVCCISTGGQIGHLFAEALGSGQCPDP